LFANLFQSASKRAACMISAGFCKVWHPPDQLLATLHMM